MATIDTKGNTGDQTQGDTQSPQDLHVREPLTLILPDNNKFTSYLFSTFKRSTNAIMVLLIVAAIPVTLVLLSNQQDVRQRAGFESTQEITEKYNISGRIFIDTNNNGTRDSWENGPKGAVVLVSNDNVKIEVPTDDFGGYSFEKFGGLLPGPYTVTLNIPNGFSPIAASTINVKLGPEDAIVDFGVKRASDQPKPSL